LIIRKIRLKYTQLLLIFYEVKMATKAKGAGKSAKTKEAGKGKKK
jgi:hypothetical protein